MRKEDLCAWLLCLAVGVAVPACEGNDPLAPFEPEVSNIADSFQLQATNVRAITTTLEYTWVNNGTVADVDHSTTTTTGSTRLIIRDADGNPVYDKPLAASLNEPTLAGRSGAWSIRLVLTDFSGTLNFRLQKP